MPEETMRVETYVVGGGSASREEQLLADLVRANDECNRLRDRVAELERLLFERQ
jgi:hypothetical protein